MAKEKKPSFFSSLPRSVKILAGMVVIIGIYLRQAPCPIDPAPFSLSPPPPLEPNTLLRKAVKLGPGNVEGPESLAFIDDKFILAGLADGRIVALDVEWGQVDTILFTGEPQRALPLPCAEYTTEHLCGRPLGMQFDARGMLYVADAYKGLLEINVTSAKRASTVLSTAPSDGGAKKRPFAFPNGVAVSQQPKGPVFFTDSSTMFHRRDVGLLLLDNRPTGRVLQYSPLKRQSTTLLSDLSFPNGILLDPQEEYILVAELGKAQIIKYYLKGSQQGKLTVWAANLPILPDNLSWDINPDGKPNGKVWVAGTKRSWIFEILAKIPVLRTVIAKVMKPESIVYLASTEAIALRLDAKGDILDAPQDSSGRITAISGVYPHGDAIYLAAWRKETKFIGKVPRADLRLRGE